MHLKEKDVDEKAEELKELIEKFEEAIKESGNHDQALLLEETAKEIRRRLQSLKKRRD